MNSKVINKLIRSEIWPLLRQQGFSKFDSRTAWRYHGSWVDVVNFQSFNSYLADSLGCTTYSFCLRLGVHMWGAMDEELIPGAGDEQPRPPECHCPFRTALVKRAAVDRFVREDIFYIDPDGNTTGPVFQEVQRLLREEAPVWFDAFCDVDIVLALLRGERALPAGAERYGLGHYSRPGSFYWLDLLATLVLLRHSPCQTDDDIAQCLHAVNDAIGKGVENFSPLLESPVYIERMNRRWRKQLLRVSGTARGDRLSAVPQPEAARLFGTAWSEELPSATPRVVEEVTPRAQIWPLLRDYGFTEFSNRLAHRQEGNRVDVVAFAPMDPVERREGNHPAGLFRLGIGVYWPAMVCGEDLRRNRKGDPRPTLAQCTLVNWISVAEPAFQGPTLFSTAAAAKEALAGDAVAWFRLCIDPESLLAFLALADWEILANFPSMRGQGGASGAQRHFVKATLFGEIGDPDRTAEQLRAAETAVDRSADPDHRKEYLYQRLRELRARLLVKA